MVEMADRAVPHGPAHEAHEYRIVPGHESGNAEGLEALDGVGVLGLENVERPSGVDLGEDRIAVDTCLSQHSGQDLSIAQIKSLIVARPKERSVNRQEVLRLLLPHHDPGEIGSKTRVPIRFVPDRDATFLDVALLEREDHEANIPLRASLQAGQ